MQSLIYPLKYMRITQGYNGETSHYKHSHSSDGIIDYSLDDGGKDTGNGDYFYAPCDLKITKIYLSGTNTFWWESINKVKLANGKESKVCGYVIHCPDSSLKKLKVGQTFKQKAAIAQEGKDGATGYHFHHAVSLGEVEGTGWVKNKAGAWVLTGTGAAIKPEQAYFVDHNFTKVLNDGKLNWKKYVASAENTTTSTSTVKYFPKYTGKSTSLVDALASMNITSTYSYRAKIAKANKISAYVGTAKQNTSMLKLLKAGKLIKP